MKPMKSVLLVLGCMLVTALAYPDDSVQGYPWQVAPQDFGTDGLTGYGEDYHWPQQERAVSNYSDPDFALRESQDECTAQHSRC